VETLSPANASLQEIIDHHEIRKLLSTYCHACDRADWARMRDVYGKDSWDDHGTYRGPGRDFPKVVMETLAASGGRYSHLLGQSQIRSNGNSGGAETYFIATICEKNEHSQEVITLLGGRYVDTFVREGDQWKIDQRICVRDWSYMLDVKEDPLRNHGFVLGLLSKQDPSYAALGLSQVD
jgi:hypothetical protein